MKLDLDRQPAGRSRLETRTTQRFEDPADMPAAVELTGDLRVDNLESRVLVRGSLTARAEVPCDRCLKPFTLACEVPVDLLVIRDRGSDEEPDTWVIHQRTGEVDLTEPLREAILLALPLKRLCAESCRGFCPQCGADLNVEPCDCETEPADPRWGGLPTD